MNGDGRIRRFNEAFQYVDDELLDLVEKRQDAGRRKRVGRIRIVMGAACACLMIVLPGAAWAQNWFGLRKLIVRESGFDKAMISLSGYVDSPETQALIEWKEFLAHCGANEKNLSDREIFDDILAVESRKDWWWYTVYSREMGEKLDEIVAKYGLKLHTERYDVDWKECVDWMGGSFLDWNQRAGVLIYEDGSFSFDGDVGLSGCRTTVPFQFSRSVKGTFHEVGLSVGQVEAYTEWQYVTACGEPVLLALGSGKALILADFEECFISVNVLIGSEGGMTKEGLQELADLFDFKVLKDVKAHEAGMIRDVANGTQFFTVKSETPQSSNMRSWRACSECTRS